MTADTLWTTGRQPIAIVGPTATGKTDAAMELASSIGGEIINADSVQVYRSLDIGSAKPNKEAQARVRFHLLDVAEPDQQFTVSDWKLQAEAAIEDCFQRGKQPIVCGGTGLYIRALVEDWSLATTPGDLNIRRELEAERNTNGVQSLYARLQAIDADTAARLHPNDALRIIRALEVYQVTNTPLSVYQAEDRRTRPPRPVRRFGLTLPREELYTRIDGRVETMLAAGFIEEVRQLYAQGCSSEFGAMKSLGYREVSAFLLSKCTYEAAVEEIKRNTRRFAKRQLTWFRADAGLEWIDVCEKNAKEVAAVIKSKFSEQPERQHTEN